MEVKREIPQNPIVRSALLVSILVLMEVKREIPMPRQRSISIVFQSLF